jgi:hypothetical protein
MRSAASRFPGFGMLFIGVWQDPLRGDLPITRSRPTREETQELNASRAVVLKLFWLAAHCKIYKKFLAHFVYKIKNILIYFKLWIKIDIQMSFFSFFKYTFIIFAAQLATSCGAPFENHFSRGICTDDLSVRVDEDDTAEPARLLWWALTDIRTTFFRGFSIEAI